MNQAWLDTLENNFRPAEVKLGCREGTLLVLSTMLDQKIFTRAARDNERLWDLGDVFEIFLRDTTREEYLELHVSPNGHRLQLRFPSSETVKKLRGRLLKLEDLIVREPLFDFSTRTTSDGWEVFAEIPTTGTNLLASFSRYDYSGAETPPVLSSTSAHAKADYHRQEEWVPLTLPL